jgi:hypothetical protein
LVVVALIRGEAGGVVGAVRTDGDPDEDAEADGDGEADLDRDRDGEADGGEDGDTLAGGAAMVTRGIDGRTTVGCRLASAGPPARTATQTTRVAIIAAAMPKMRRAGPNGRAECLAGNGRFPLQIKQDWPGTIPVSPCLWHGGPGLC